MKVSYILRSRINYYTVIIFLLNTNEGRGMVNLSWKKKNTFSISHFHPFICEGAHSSCADDYWSLSFYIFRSLCHFCLYNSCSPSFLLYSTLASLRLQGSQHFFLIFNFPLVSPWELEMLPFTERERREFWKSTLRSSLYWVCVFFF